MNKNISVTNWQLSRISRCEISRMHRPPLEKLIMMFHTETVHKQLEFNCWLKMFVTVTGCFSIMYIFSSVLLKINESFSWYWLPDSLQVMTNYSQTCKVPSKGCLAYFFVNTMKFNAMCSTNIRTPWNLMLSALLTLFWTIHLCLPTALTSDAR